MPGTQVSGLQQLADDEHQPDGTRDADEGHIGLTQQIINVARGYGANHQYERHDRRSVQEIDGALTRGGYGRHRAEGPSRDLEGDHCDADEHSEAVHTGVDCEPKNLHGRSSEHVRQPWGAGGGASEAVTDQVVQQTVAVPSEDANNSYPGQSAGQRETENT